MKSILARTLVLVFLVAPVFALAQTSTLSVTSAMASLSITPLFFGMAPAVTMFVVHDPSGTEAIDFGDGYSSGSNGCTKNSAGWCDFSQPVWHTYQVPGTYTVSLYAHYQPRTYQLLSTSTVVVKPGISGAIPF